MNNLTKTIIYVVLVIAALFFGLRFYSEYKANKATRGDNTELSSTDNSDEGRVAKAVSPTNAAPPDTNQTAAPTNGDTNTAAVSNAVAVTTNATVASTNEASATASNESAPPAEKKAHGSGSMMGYMGAFLATVIILGIFLAKDVSSLLGQTTIDFLFNDDLKGVYDPEYEQALNAVHAGQYLAAIQMLRDFLQKNPHAQYAALEIADIYEKNLNNPLAAALEYEEILKKKLPPERWGWAAIHLCNIYSKLDKMDKTVELLRRIVKEYPDTAAAKKAAKRLAMYENGGDADQLGTDVPEGMEKFAQTKTPAAAAGGTVTPKVDAAPAATPAKPAVVVKVRGKVEPKKETPASNLPPGFRPK
jgi:TolA-binding protein